MNVVESLSPRARRVLVALTERFGMALREVGDASAIAELQSVGLLSDDLVVQLTAAGARALGELLDGRRSLATPCRCMHARWHHDEHSPHACKGCACASFTSGAPAVVDPARPYR